MKPATLPGATEPWRVATRGDGAVARIAAGQRGLVTAAQLKSVGLSSGAIAHRIRSGALHRVHRGVYRWGTPLPLPWSRELAAVLAVGGGAVASGLTAAQIWELPTPAPEGAEITVHPASGARSRSGIAIRRSALAPHVVTRKLGIPVTTPARTIVDLAARLPEPALERAIGEARVKRLVSDRKLHEALARAPGAQGRSALRALLDREGRPQLTRSEMERRLLRLIRAASLPEPVANATVEGEEVDLYWAPQSVVVEADSWSFHGHRHRFERDARRTALLEAAGYRVRRFTWRQINEEPLVVVAVIALALGR